MKLKNKVAATFATLLITIFLFTGCTAALPTASDKPATNTNEAVALAQTQEDTAVATNNPVSTNPITEAAVDGTLASIYERVNPSVVHIEVVGQPVAASLDPSQQPNFPFSQQPQTPLQGEGSGFVWDNDGHIVTNNHVIADASKITVVFADDRSVEATVVGTDPDSDLAVLQVDVPAEALQPVQLGDATAVHVGDLAIAIGDPFGEEGTMTVGIISALGRLLPTNLEGVSQGPSYNIPDIIQTDAAINPGNSGGVLLNAQGQVIGVTSAIISPARVSSGIGFAIPMTLVQEVVPALISDGHYDHPYIGISGMSLTPEIAQAMGLPADQMGALVGEVMADSPADAAGLLGSSREAEIDGRQVLIGGDVITAFDGHAVHSMDDLITHLGRYGQIGQDSTLTLLRDGKEQSVTITLAARPVREATETVAANTSNRPHLGIAGIALTPDIAQEMGLDEGQQGVLIVQIQANSAADEAGLHGSDRSLMSNGQQVMVGGDVITAVDGQTITSVPELQAAIAQAKPGDKMELTILRDGAEMQVMVTLGE